MGSGRLDYAFIPVTRDSAPPLTGPAGDPARAVLTGLAEACGLGTRLPNYGPAIPPRRDTVRELWPGLHELITQTRAAADSAVLAPRRNPPPALRRPGRP